VKTLIAWLRLPTTIWRLLWYQDMPIGPKIALGIAIIYLLLPMGIIPDRAFGLLGYLDDIALLVLTIAWFLIRAPDTIIRRAQDSNEES
jgi:uncharacterized membrane protein YkvA (DUF1232 family)